MAERESLGRASINYEGIFNVKELVKTIQDAGKDKKFSFINQVKNFYHFLIYIKDYEYYFN